MRLGQDMPQLRRDGGEQIGRSLSREELSVRVPDQNFDHDAQQRDERIHLVMSFDQLADLLGQLFGRRFLSLLAVHFASSPSS